MGYSSYLGSVGSKIKNNIKTKVTSFLLWQKHHVCNLNLTFISNSFWNKGGKFDEKRVITPK
jgi:hypothetical protein